MHFIEAFKLLIDGKADYIRLPKWSTEVKIKQQLPEPHSLMSHPYLYADSRFGRVPWIPTWPELYAREWEAYQMKRDRNGRKEYEHYRVDADGLPFESEPLRSM